MLAIGLAAGSQAATDPCAPPVNRIACENSKPGNPPSEWDINGSGDASIQGFATDISVNHGQTVSFKISTNASAYHIDVYRLGYYGGQGARKITTVLPSASLPQTQPACLKNTTTGLTDCGNWAVSASWAVPADAVSGLYIAKLIRNDTGGASHIPFVVRDDEGHSELLFQTSDETWQAYNSYGGASLYKGNGPASDYPPGRAYKVSYNRPFDTRGSGDPPTWWSDAEYPMIRWLEANGYNVSYTTDVDSARRGAEILEHKTYLSVGHDEYWSGDQRANVEAARDAGVNLAFFSGNEVYWKTRWEPSIDGSSTAFRTLVCYKEDTAKLDPTAAWTGRWADPSFSPPSDGGRAQNALTGQQYSMQFRNDAMTIPAEFGNMRFWRNTSVASLAPGQVATTAAGILAYEWDLDLDNGFRPAGIIHMSESAFPNVDYFVEGIGNVRGTATHNLTLYRAPSGALVFGAGTVQWSWALDNHHASGGDAISPGGEGPAVDPRLQQATANMFADMGSAPATLQPGLVMPVGSTDRTGPATTFISPAPGTSFPASGTVTLTGTANDAEGVVAYVEVSTDGGHSWQRATGHASWSYTWSPGNGPTGTFALKARAIDDLANTGSPANLSVTVQQRPGLVAAYAFNEGSGTTVADGSGKGNNGTISGAAWTAAGEYDSALSFNGTSSFVNVPNSTTLNPGAGATVEAWVKPTVGNDWRTAVMKQTTSDFTYALYANTSSNQPSGYIAADRVDGPSLLPLNQWTFLALTYDGGSVKLYVNGQEVDSSSHSGAVPTSTGPLRIGGNTIWGEFFQGLIDEVRVYNRGLAAGEVNGDMVTPIANTPPTPDTTAPTVSLTAPADGATVLGPVSVSANAADNVGVAGVQFKLDNGNLGAEDTSAPYSIAWDTTTVTDGPHVLKAVARDAATNQTTSASVNVTVQNADTTFPTVSLTAPADGATVFGPVTVSAGASDNRGVAGVQFQVDGNNVGAEDTSAPYSVSWDSTTVGDGPHAVAAIARDAANNKTTSTAANVTVQNADLIAPSTPTGLHTTAITTNSISVAWNPSTDNRGVTGYGLYVYGLASGFTSLTSATFSSLGCGTSYDLGVDATDAATNRSSIAAITVSTVACDTTPPTVSLTAPANGATVSGSINVTADAADNAGVAGVHFKLDGNDLGAEDTSAPYSVSWATGSASNGLHTLTAVARDTSNNPATSSGVTVTVNNSATPGLVAAYSFNEGLGNTVNDASGTGNNGSVSNTTWTTAGKFGGALTFNGTSSWVTIPDASSLDFTNVYTLEAWIKASVLSSWRTVFLKEFGGSFSYAFYANTSSNRARVYVGETGLGINSASKLAVGSWVHLAATYDGATLRMYVNGTQVASSAISATMPNSTGPLRIGGNSIWSEWFQGQIDEVRIYNRALAAAAIQTDMNTPVSP